MRSPIIALILSVAALPAFAADLSISFSGNDVADGPVMVALHDQAQSFDDRDAPGMAMMALPAGTSGVTVTGLPSGRYAVKAFLDDNRDRALNVDLVGRPTEKVAVSGTPTTGWPDFTAAAFQLDTETRLGLTFAKP